MNNVGGMKKLNNGRTRETYKNPSLLTRIVSLAIPTIELGTAVVTDDRIVGVN